MTADEIICAARSALRTPFRHQGRVPGLGLDCAGLLVHVCRTLGIEPDDVQGYGRNPHNGLIEQAIARQPYLCQVAKEAMQPGDVLLMRFSLAPQHVAIATDCGVIHAYEHSGAVVEHRLADVWRSRITHVYRFRDLT